jgi:hypothetical protein
MPAMETIGPLISVASQFVAAGELFDLEYAGGFIRIWCRACDKFEHLSNDRPGTVDAARLVHRCGARTSEWACDDLGVRV